MRSVQEMSASSNDVHRSRAAQVGFLMRAYRESFVWEDGRRGLTQEELLQRMAAVDSDYSERFSHATVSRWESGATRPTVSRLEVFGKAVGLTAAEIEGLIALATFQPIDGNTLRQRRDTPRFVGAGRPMSDIHDGGAGGRSVGIAANSPIFFSGLFNYVLVKYLALSSCIVGTGYALSFMGWNPDWMPAAYVFLITLIVMAQGFLLPSRDSNLSDFYFVSIFFVLTTPLLQFERLDMDHYGLYRIDNIAGTHMPYMLALLVNLLLGATAGVASKVLWKWQYSVDPAESNPIRRAIWAIVPPIAFVYAVIVVISNTSVWIQLAILLPALAAMFTVMVTLRDPSLNPTEKDRQYLLVTVTTLGILSTLAGIITVMAIYISPDLPMVLPDHNLVRSWEINFDELGFTRAEAMNRINLGYLWHAVCVAAYMFFVVGGNTIVAIYRMGVTSAVDVDAALWLGLGQPADDRSRIPTGARQ